MSEHSADNSGTFLAGFVIGGLIGAAVALIFAPTSGDKTRGQIVGQSLNLKPISTDHSKQNGYFNQANGHRDEALTRAEDAPRIILDKGNTTEDDSAE